MPSGEILLGICAGGSLRGELWPTSDAERFSFTIHERHIQSDGNFGSLETPTLEETYVLAHLVPPGDFSRAWHVWYVDNGDTPEQMLTEALRVLLDASASERAAVECRSVNDCQLTSHGEVVR